jgi:hypothetical protein
MTNSKPQGLFDNFEFSSPEFASPFKIPSLQISQDERRSSFGNLLQPNQSNLTLQPPTMFDLNNFDYGLSLPQYGQTVVTVPSPWIQAIASPIGTPMLGTPMMTPYSPAMNTMMTPMQSPFMGSPYLSPFDAPLNQPMYQDASLDISNWWSENGSLIDTKPFSQLLQETGMGVDVPELEINDQPELSEKVLCPEVEPIPDARFWKTIKSGGQTLYQCPFPGCEKSIFFVI